jgi:hypothetical protein
VAGHLVGPGSGVSSGSDYEAGHGLRRSGWLSRPPDRRRRPRLLLHLRLFRLLDQLRDTPMARARDCRVCTRSSTGEPRCGSLCPRSDGCSPPRPTPSTTHANRFCAGQPGAPDTRPERWPPVIVAASTSHRRSRTAPAIPIVMTRTARIGNRPRRPCPQRRLPGRWCIMFHMAIRVLIDEFRYPCARRARWLRTKTAGFGRDTRGSHE